jgi:hypothetical protein
MTTDQVIERLLAMKENIVTTAIQLGWRPDVKKLWEKWLDIIGVDEDTTLSLVFLDLLEEKCSSDELRLEWLIEKGFVSTEAENFMDGVNLTKTE